jgi:hypothetical protein
MTVGDEDHSRNKENAQWQKIFLTHNVVGVYANRLMNVMSVLRLCSVALACVSTRSTITNHHCASRQWKRARHGRRTPITARGPAPSTGRKPDLPLTNRDTQRTSSRDTRGVADHHRTAGLTVPGHAAVARLVYRLCSWEVLT